MNYEELVKALRSASTVSTAWEKLMWDAAAAIEDMAKHITEMHERVTVLQIARGELEAEVKRLNMRCADCEYASKPWPELEPKRGKWIWIQKANGGQYKGCSVCHAPIPTDSMLDYLDDEDCDFCYSCGAKMEVQDGQ